MFSRFHIFVRVAQALVCIGALSLLPACGGNGFTGGIGGDGGFFGSGFGGSGGGGSNGFTRGKTKDGNGRGLNNANGANGTNGLPFGSSGQRGDLNADYGDDDHNLYVPLIAEYQGAHAGDDAVYKIFVQRERPAVMFKSVELFETASETTRSKRVPKFCRCGQTTTAVFLYQHRSGFAGAWHNPHLNYGEWMIGHHVSDSKWLEGNLKSLQQGQHTVFGGADTENPTAFMRMNSAGQGRFRTKAYHPNSIFGDKHIWENRDDIRFGLSCDINQCPAELRGSTVLNFRHNPTYAPGWRY